MCSKGMATRVIEDHLREIHGVDASPALISVVVDKILPAARDWRNSLLDGLFPVALFGGVWHKARKDGKAAKKRVCSALGTT